MEGLPYFWEKYAIDVIYEFAGKYAMDAITQCLIEYFKRDLEAAVKRLEAAERENRKLRQDYINLQRSYDGLEEWANDQEARADAMRDIINGFIDNSTNTVRRELLQEFNRVANELDIDLDISDDEETIDLMEDITGLDEFFDT